MKRIFAVIIVLGMALFLFQCKGKAENNGGKDAIDKTIAQDKAYNQCTENIATIIKHIGLYKKYNQKSWASLAEIETEYNLKAVCPLDGAAYELKSIVPQPDEEINSENIQASYDEPARRTYKIICPSHRLTVYGD
jgi:hypothetical protein